MQACGPVVRPHEILQTLIISIPQPSAAVKSFFELSRNFGAPEAMSAFFFTVSRRQAFRRYSGSPLEARFTLEVSVDNGRLRRPGVPGSPGGDKRGQGTDGSLSPLDTPDPPLDATPSGRASKCEGPTGAFGAPRVRS